MNESERPYFLHVLRKVWSDLPDDTKIVIVDNNPWHAGDPPEIIELKTYNLSIPSADDNFVQSLIFTAARWGPDCFPKEIVVFLLIQVIDDMKNEIFLLGQNPKYPQSGVMHASRLPGA